MSHKTQVWQIYYLGQIGRTAIFIYDIISQKYHTEEGKRAAVVNISLSIESYGWAGPLEEYLIFSWADPKQVKLLFWMRVQERLDLH